MELKVRAGIEEVCYWPARGANPRRDQADQKFKWGKVNLVAGGMLRFWRTGAGD